MHVAVDGADERHRVAGSRASRAMAGTGDLNSRTPALLLNAAESCSRIPGSAAPRRIEDLRRRAGLDDVALVHEEDLRRHSRTKAISCETKKIVMPSAREQADDVEHLVHKLGIERRGDLVEQHDLGLECQRPRDRDALLLAAGQLVRIRVELVAEADAIEQFRSHRPRLGGGWPFTLTGAIVTLASTLMFWNRLYCWKTIAMRERRCRTAALL